jgi:hypothetical protein
MGRVSTWSKRPKPHTRPALTKDHHSASPLGMGTVTIFARQPDRCLPRSHRRSVPTELVECPAFARVTAIPSGA